MSAHFKMSGHSLKQYGQSLFSRRSFYRTSRSTSAAVNALVGIDNELAVTLRNRFNGAVRCASAAADALIGNFISH